MISDDTLTAAQTLNHLLLDSFFNLAERTWSWFSGKWSTEHQKLTSEPFRFLCVLCKVHYNSLCKKYQYTSSSFNTTFHFEKTGLRNHRHVIYNPLNRSKLILSFINISDARGQHFLCNPTQHGRVPRNWFSEWKSSRYASSIQNCWPFPWRTERRYSQWERTLLYWTRGKYKRKLS